MRIEILLPWSGAGREYGRGFVSLRSQCAAVMVARYVGVQTCKVCRGRLQWRDRTLERGRSATINYHAAMEDEDAPPVGRDPIAQLTEAAVELGLVRAGDKPDQNLIDFWMRAVDAAATIGDKFPHPDVEEDTVGDEIRAHLYE